MYANCFIFLLHAGHIRVTTLVTEQRAGHADGATRVLHIHHRTRVLRLDLHRCMCATGGRTADQQRNREPFTLHLASEKRHLFQ